MESLNVSQVRPTHRLSIPVEQFDLKFLPDGARSIPSEELARAISEFIEGQFFCVGKQATARVVGGRIEVDCECGVEDHDFASRLIGCYRDGWLPGRPILLRLWFSQHQKEWDNLREVVDQSWDDTPADELRYWERELRCLLEVAPGDADARIALGENLLLQGQQNEALAVVDPMDETAVPESARRTRLGLLFLKLGEASRARQYFLAALGLNDRDQTAWMGLAESCSALGDLVTAGRAYDKVIELDWFSERATEAQWKRVVNTALVLFQGKQVAD